MMENFGQAMSHVFGMSVIHSLWQGLLIFLLLKIILVCVPSISSAKKHNLALAALFILTGWFISTIIVKANTVNWFAGNSDPLIIQTALTTGDSLSVSYPTFNYADIIDEYLPYITITYLIGLLFQLIKLGLAWNAITRIKRSLSPAPGFSELIKRLSEKLGINKQVIIRHSHLVNVPGVIGYAKPLILLPVSFTCNLSLAEAESILLHELAHIKRNDFLINLVQRVISIILFFNPFVQLINSIIDGERENSCDDLVVKITDSPLLYAHALLKLEQMGNDHLNLALAATGKKYRLLNRIERIMRTENLAGNARYLITMVLLLVSVLGNIAWILPGLKEVTISGKKAVVQNMVNKGLPPVENKHESVKEKRLASQAQMRNVRPSVHKEPFYDPELEKMYKQLRIHSRNVARVFNSPRLGNPEVKIDLAELEEILKKAGSRYTPEFQKKADSIKTEYDDYPFVKNEFLLMSEEMNKIGLYINTPEYLQKIQKMSPDESTSYMKYMKKLENDLNN